MYTHRGAYLNALGEIVEAGLQSESVYLWTLPMFHCNGWCFTWAVTAAGARHVVIPKVEPARIFPLLSDEKVTHLCGAPTVLVMLQAELPRRTGAPAAGPHHHGRRAPAAVGHRLREKEWPGHRKRIN